MAVRDTFVSVVLFPVYVWQGLSVRRKVERMTPPSGSVSGLACGSEPSDGVALNILVVGDSSAAGVGVPIIGQSLAPQLAERLRDMTGRCVAWRAAGANSAVSAEIRDHVVPHVPRETFTHIFLMIGSNDAKNFHSARRFKKGFGGLLYALRTKWPEARIVWSPPVDLKRVPALPRGLATVLEARARVIRSVGARLCMERGAVAASILPLMEPAGFARDGFHASAAGYAYMAGHLATHVQPGGTPREARQPAQPQDRHD